MWPFGKRQDPEVTTEAYGRWIRAQRPPFAWFARLSQPEQEALARVGDDYAENLAVAFGYAVHDPAAAAAGVDAQRGDQTAESDLLARMATATVERIQAAARKATTTAAPAKPRPSPLDGMTKPTMAGIKGRREASA